MMYIHGGLFERGSSRNAPPHYLLEQNIVLVVPQYRLGPLGFLSTQSDDIPGDAALQDILLALKWCQLFIGRFGGDPNRVTIFGQSSGSAMVSALIASPTVPNDLFHRAILQSGSILAPRSFDMNPLKNARNIGKYCGCDEKSSVDHLNKCLLSANTVTLLKAYQEHVVSKLWMWYCLGSYYLAKYNRLTIYRRNMCDFFQQNNIPSGFLNYGGAKLTYSKLVPLAPLDLVEQSLANRDISLMVGVTRTEGAFILGSMLLIKYSVLYVQICLFVFFISNYSTQLCSNIWKSYLINPVNQNIQS